MDRRLRARVLLAEAQALGVTIADLIAAARDTPTAGPAVPTVAQYVDSIAKTMSAGTPATYRSYWRLPVARFGDRPLGEVGVDECEAVVADAVARAQHLHEGTTQRGRRRRRRPHRRTPPPRPIALTPTSTTIGAARTGHWPAPDRCRPQRSRSAPERRRDRGQRRCMTGKPRPLQQADWLRPEAPQIDCGLRPPRTWGGSAFVAGAELLQDRTVTVEDDLLAVARRQLAPSSQWALSTERNAGGFVLVAEHPASAGLMFETGTFDSDEAERHIAWLMRQREFPVADAAPELAHPDTVSGVRGLVVAFNWPTVQVRAVAFLLFDAGVLTADEAGWLAGFVALDAPMVTSRPDGR
jgi:hypothetical protein